MLLRSANLDCAPPFSPRTGKQWRQAGLASLEKADAGSAALRRARDLQPPTRRANRSRSTACRDSARRKRLPTSIARSTPARGVGTGISKQMKPCGRAATVEQKLRRTGRVPGAQGRRSGPADGCSYEIHKMRKAAQATGVSKGKPR